MSRHEKSPKSLEIPRMSMAGAEGFEYSTMLSRSVIKRLTVPYIVEF